MGRHVPLQSVIILGTFGLVWRRLATARAGADFIAAGAENNLTLSA